MKNRCINCFFICLIAISIIFSCKGGGSLLGIGKTEPNPNIPRYTLKILTTNIICDNNKLPLGIKQFALPIESNVFKGKFFMPDIKSEMIQIDSPLVKVSLYCEAPLNSIQNGLDAINRENLDKGTSDFMETISNDSMSYQSSMSYDQKLKILMPIVSQSKNTTFFVYSSDSKLLTFAINSEKNRVFHSIDSIRLEIDNLMLTYYKNNANVDHNFIILFDPPFIDTIKTDTPSKAEPKAKIKASRTSIPKGESVTLSWTSSDATNLSIDQGIGKVASPSGSITVRPVVDMIYTILNDEKPLGQVRVGILGGGGNGGGEQVVYPDLKIAEDGKRIKWTNLGAGITYKVKILRKRTQEIVLPLKANGSSFTFEELDGLDEEVFYVLTVYAINAKGTIEKCAKYNFKLKHSRLVSDGLCESLRSNKQNTECE